MCGITQGSIHPDPIARSHVATPHLDGKHSVFGQVTNGQHVVDAIKQGDRITSIDIHDDTAPLFESRKDDIEHWKSILDR